MNDWLFLCITIIPKHSLPVVCELGIAGTKMFLLIVFFFFLNSDVSQVFRAYGILTALNSLV